MQYTLMHKNVPVVDMEVDETGFIAKLSKVHDERHLPVGVQIFSTGVDRKALNDWWLGRSIPASRVGLSQALLSMGVASSVLLIEKCFGLSLSDQYWVRPDEDITWESVNFFTNKFSTDVGEILFGRDPNDPARISLFSPDNTSDGWLRKKWIIAGSKRFLMKGGSGVFHQEPFNEVIASLLMTRLGVNHVDYTLTFDGEKPFSLCENFVTPTTELVPAYRVIESIKKSNQDSYLTHLLRCCEHFGIANAQGSIDWMLTLDYIISNEDRHYNNFGFIRNAETLEWQGFAPIFDSGSSLWHNTARVGTVVDSKPFKGKHEEQIKLVNDLSWFDFGKLDRVAGEIVNILSQSPDIEEARAKAISQQIVSRAERVEHRKAKL
ncbi:MAG: excisionase [Clostridiales bacterium]|jgi:hypothetical protein|nr:excisionase [Clostridiales bacterium]